MSSSQVKEIKELLDNANKEAKKYVPNETISENDVVKVWRDTYS